MTDSALFQRLRRPLLGCALSLAASATLLVWTHAERGAARLQLQQESTRLAQARSRHLELRERQSASVAAATALAALDMAGQRIPADRRAWHAHLQARAGTLDWEITPARPYPGPQQGAPAHDAGQAGFVASTLHLRGAVPHEGHLLAALERPTGHSQGLFLRRHCHLARSADATSPGLTVDCEIDWISLQPPAGPP